MREALIGRFTVLQMRAASLEVQNEILAWTDTDMRPNHAVHDEELPASMQLATFFFDVDPLLCLAYSDEMQGELQKIRPQSNFFVELAEYVAQLPADEDDGHEDEGAMHDPHDEFDAEQLEVSHVFPLVCVSVYVCV